MMEVNTAELDMIADLIRHKYGYDFRNYAASSFKRRVVRLLELKQMSVGGLLQQLSQQPDFINEFLAALTVNVTEMFRDYTFWRLLRDVIIPSIRTVHPQFKIWHAGCSSGEEVFSMAILLHEMGLAQDATIIASDLDEEILAKARAGSFPMKNMALNESNYAQFGGQGTSLAGYYNEENGQAVFNRTLIHATSFLKHDLVTGDVFNNVDLILCRNVMIYFNQALQNEVLKKFHGSLVTPGYLAIGSKESLIWCDIASKFSVVDGDEKIYRKIAD